MRLRLLQMIPVAERDPKVHRVNKGWLLAVVTIVPGCFAPPLIGGERIEEPQLAIEAHLASYPTDVPVRAVALAGAGAPPDGLFVDIPAGPLVVHFLPSGLSFVSQQFGFQRIATQLADLGIGSLVFDYPGVGLSRNSKHHEELREFADAAIRRARDLAPGRELVLRGTSLGSMVAASVLELHEDIAAVTWIAAVRPETVVLRFARCAAMWVPGTLLAPWFRRPQLASPWDVAGQYPGFFVASENDPLLADRHRESLTELVRKTGGRAEIVARGAHVIPSRYVGCLARGEADFLLHRTSADPHVAWANLSRRLGEKFLASREDLDAFEALLGDAAIETALGLLLVHRGLKEPRDLDLLPRRPDGLPIDPSIWLPHLDELRTYLAPAGSRTPELLKPDPLFGVRRVDRVEGLSLRLVLEGWPFREELRMDFDRDELEPEEFLALLAYFAGLRTEWKVDEPDGPWLAVWAEEPVLQLDEQQRERLARGESLSGSIPTKRIEFERWIHPDYEVRSRVLLPDGMIPLSEIFAGSTRP